MPGGGNAMEHLMAIGGDIKDIGEKVEKLLMRGRLTVARAFLAGEYRFRGGGKMNE